MDLRLSTSWTVVLCLAVVVNAFKDCPPPPIPNGFFVSEQDTFAHDTELYYSCNDKYKPVEGSWWASVTCQNGNWSSLPQCIEKSDCRDPEIPNANITAVQYVQNNDRLWIKCNTGYEDEKKHAAAKCVNGNWTALPVCERMVTSCGPPALIPNGIIVNEVHKDVFPEGARLEYVCRSGFELETDNETICIYGEWHPAPSCRPKETNQEPVPQPTTGSGINSGSDDNYQPTFTTIDKCGSAPVVTEGVAFNGKGNMYLFYRCNHLYKLQGSSIVRCSNGQWTQPPTCEVDFCKLDTSKHPELVPAGDVYIKSGTEEKLLCEDSDKAYAECRDHQLYLSKCCGRVRHGLGFCPYVQIRYSQ